MKQPYHDEAILTHQCGGHASVHPLTASQREARGSQSPKFCSFRDKPLFSRPSVLHLVAVDLMVDGFRQQGPVKTMRVSFSWSVVPAEDPPEPEHHRQLSGAADLQHCPSV